MENNKTKVSFSEDIAHFVDSMEHRGTSKYYLLKKYSKKLVRDNPAVFSQFEYYYINAQSSFEILQAFTLAHLRITSRKLPEKDEVNQQMNYYVDHYFPAIEHLLSSVDGENNDYDSPQNALNLAKFMITIDALERFNDNQELLEIEEQILPLYRDF